MKHIIILALAALLLAGCMGDIASPSPSYSEYRSDDDTTVTTHSESQTADLQAMGNRQECKGLIVIASCTAPQTNMQTTAPQRTASAPMQPASPAAPDLSTVCSSVLVCIGLVFWFCVAIWGIGKIFAPRN